MMVLVVLLQGNAIFNFMRPSSCRWRVRLSVVIVEWRRWRERTRFDSVFEYLANKAGWRWTEQWPCVDDYIELGFCLWCVWNSKSYLQFYSNMRSGEINTNTEPYFFKRICLRQNNKFLSIQTWLHICSASEFWCITLLVLYGILGIT